MTSGAPRTARGAARGAPGDVGADYAVDPQSLGATGEVVPRLRLLRRGTRLGVLRERKREGFHQTPEVSSGQAWQSKLGQSQDRFQAPSLHGEESSGVRLFAHLNKRQDQDHVKRSPIRRTSSWRLVPAETARTARILRMVEKSV